MEAGVRVVTLSYSFWDWHGSNFRIAKENLPDFDQALSALIEDLSDRGLLDDTTVIAWGEFGRTPKINKDGGRDHWPNVSCALMAGGKMKTGKSSVQPIDWVAKLSYGLSRFLKSSRPFITIWGSMR